LPRNTPTAESMALKDAGQNEVRTAYCL